MKSTIIIDAGSTKMEWAVLEGGVVLNRFTTKGFNPNYTDIQELKNILAEVEIPNGDIQEVYYYGSGCLRLENAALVGETLMRSFHTKEINVTNDMMGAAHAILGRQPGIACILGTGANSCLYDGEKVVDRAVSLGYLVGDEGSGCYIGRKLVRAYFYDFMPDELKLEFGNVYQLEINDFINHVYHQPEVSKYLAGFTQFAGQHIDHPFIKNLVKECFSDFINVFVLRYRQSHELPIGFVGSVAYHFQGVLQECLDAEGLAMGKVMRSPMDGLIQMYS